MPTGPNGVERAVAGCAEERRSAAAESSGSGWHSGPVEDSGEGRASAMSAPIAVAGSTPQAMQQHSAAPSEAFRAQPKAEPQDQAGRSLAQSNRDLDALKIKKHNRNKQNSHEVSLNHR